MPASDSGWSVMRNLTPSRVNTNNLGIRRVSARFRPVRIVRRLKEGNRQRDIFDSTTRDAQTSQLPFDTHAYQHARCRDSGFGNPCKRRAAGTSNQSARSTRVWISGRGAIGLSSSGRLNSANLLMAPKPVLFSSPARLMCQRMRFSSRDRPGCKCSSPFISRMESSRQACPRRAT
jgi:hypothetical protein